MKYECMFLKIHGNGNIAIHGTNGEYLKFLPKTRWLKWFMKGKNSDMIKIPDEEYQNLVDNYSGEAHKYVSSVQVRKYVEKIATPQKKQAYVPVKRDPPVKEVRTPRKHDPDIDMLLYRAYN